MFLAPDALEVNGTLSAFSRILDLSHPNRKDVAILNENVWFKVIKPLRRLAVLPNIYNFIFFFLYLNILLTSIEVLDSDFVP